MEPSRLVVVLSSSVFAKYSHFVLRFPFSDEAHVWSLAMSEALVFVGMAVLVAAQDGLAMSKTSDMRVI